MMKSPSVLPLIFIGIIRPIPQCSAIEKGAEKIASINKEPKVSRPEA
jgi:hypothetical protein